MKRVFLLCLMLLCSICHAQKPIFTTAKVKAATVYPNAAELTQTTSVMLPAGTSEIVIKNVADYLSESTVQIGAPSSVTVLSVQFTKDYISEYEPDETSPAIKKVRDSITLVEKEIQKVSIARYSEQKAIEVLDRNNQVAGTQTGLNVAELMKLMDYYKAKRTELSIADNALADKQNKLTEKLNNLKNRLTSNERKAEKTSAGKLVLQVMSDAAGTVPLNITYLTGNASWTPFYDLRADNTSTPINMIYKAQIIQQTGIDWAQVKLTLSSGQPNQNNTMPLLNAWFLRFYEQRQNADYNAAINTISADKMEEVVVQSYRKDKGYVSASTTITENQLSVSFDIDIPYDILSNGKKHSVNLKEIKLPASYRYYAVPKLEKEAFLMAEISDYSKYNLLPGEANIIFEGMYSGKTLINPNQTSDTLNLSMGRDKKISIKREKIVEKSGSRFLSSTKEQTFTYDITLRNNKKEAVVMLLKDQYPVSTDKEIVIDLLQSDGARINTETGILNWDVNLKAGETKKIRISYRVKYPKDKNIGNL